MMSAEIYILMPADPEGSFQCVRVQNGIARQITIQEAARADHESCTALLPAYAVAHFRKPLPVRSQSDAMSAALFAIEDDLAQPVEEVHLALGARENGSSERDIYAVDRGVLANWISRLETLGISPRHIVAIQSLFDKQAGTTQIDGVSILYKDGRFITLDPELPEEVKFALSSENLNTPARIVTLAELVNSHGIRNQANFRTGAFVFNSSSRQGWRNWRTAAVLAAGIVVFAMAGLLIETNNNLRAASKLESAAADRYAAIFPGTPVPANLEQESRRLLAIDANVEGAGFRKITADLYAALAELPGTQLLQLEFDGATGLAFANLSYSSAQSDAALRAIIEQRGYRMTTEDLSESDGRITGRVQLEPAQ